MPGKWLATEVLSFDPLTALSFYILYQRRDRLMRPHSYQNMNMIWHAVYLEHLVIICLENASDILVQPAFPFRIYQGSTIFYSEYELNVNLGVGVWHRSFRLSVAR